MDTGNTIIHSYDEVPAFQSEVEEAEYWATHELSEELVATTEPVPEDELTLPRTRPVSMRLDQDIIRRVRALASQRQKSYLALMREFITDRLYEEERRTGALLGNPAFGEDRVVSHSPERHPGRRKEQ